MTALAHLVQADAIAERAGSLLAGAECVIWREALDGGPSIGAPGSEPWLDARAQHLATGGGGHDPEVGQVRAELARQEAALDRLASSADEVVLWLGNDLVCLLHELYWLSRWQAESAAGRLQRVAPPNGHAGCLLDQGVDLADRFAARTEVADAEVALAARAFTAFAAADPRELDAFLSDRTTIGTRPAAALRRHRERFPALGSGLGRVEEAVLRALALGARALPDLMAPIGAALPEFATTDEQLHRILRRLADPGFPLVEIGAGDWRTAALVLTPLAGVVLGGARDFAAECEGTLWLGGVEVGPDLPAWRFDRAAGAIVSI